MKKRTWMRLALLLFSFSAVVVAAELPITEVVLYKHGLGYFERSGEVPADEAATLQFKAVEMDDVLKSLTLTSTGPAVAAVRYDSSEPLTRKLADFPFEIERGAALARILDQFKGSGVQLRLGGDRVEGTIISARIVAAAQGQAERQELSLITESGEVLTLDPSAAAGLRFVDTELQQEFRDYLALIAAARDRDKRRLLIRTEGRGAGRITARYTIPTPVWKSTYRLIFDDRAEPLLEGWAIVHNTTGEDWTNTRLSLVSGRPVSFLTKLYEPDYRPRPVVELPDSGPARPVIHGGAVENEVAEAAASIASQRRVGLRANRQIAAAAPMEEAAMMERDDAFREQALWDGKVESSVAQTAFGADLGELFEYRIEKPVTVRKSESTSLPFIQQRLGARKLLIFNQENGSQHPMNAAELTNSSGRTLDGGTVTVFDGGAYAGESLVQTIKEDDKRLISYAVDLGTRITTKFGSNTKNLSKFTLRRGLLTTRQSLKETRTYTIRNVDAKAKTLIIEQRARPSYKLLEPKLAEKTKDSYRFEVALKPSATTTFTVVEEKELRNSLYITNLTLDQLISYVRNPELDEAGREKLRQIADVKRSIADADRELERLEKEINEMFQDQDRIRRNISSLRSVGTRQQQVQEYAEKLAMQEERLVTMGDRQAELRDERSKLQEELNTLIENLEV